MKSFGKNLLLNSDIRYKRSIAKGRRTEVLWLALVLKEYCRIDGKQVGNSMKTLTKGWTISIDAFGHTVDQNKGCDSGFPVSAFISQ